MCCVDRLNLPLRAEIWQSTERAHPSGNHGRPTVHERVGLPTRSAPYAADGKPMADGSRSTAVEDFSGDDVAAMAATAPPSPTDGYVLGLPICGGF